MSTYSPSVSATVAAPVIDNWWRQREARARALLNYSSTQVDTAVDFNYQTYVPGLIGPGGLPVQDKALNGFVYNMSINGQIVYDSPTGAGATLIANPKVGSWYACRKFRIDAVPTASFVLPLSVDSGGPSFTNYIEFGWFQSVSTTVPIFLMGGASPAVGTIQTNLTGFALGTANMPFGIPVDAEFIYDSLIGEFWMTLNGAECIRLKATTLSGGLGPMPVVGIGPCANVGNSSMGLRNYGCFVMYKGSQG